MSVNNEPEFLVIAGVGLLGQRYKFKGQKSLSSFLSENFLESSRPFRIIMTHAQESKEFICEIKDSEMIVHMDYLGKKINLGCKPIEEAVALMKPALKKKDKSKFDTLGIIIGFTIFWVVLLVLVDRFSPEPSEAARAQRDCLANAALLALQNNETEYFGDYSRRCY